ncbi:DJ-1/PfpI family protein [Bacteroides reticulotermitis]|uniref:Protease n=2 Tax=Bacteroides reticulotermitis TaxID=1133319 RepID=W4UXU7_9BACE|nr:DJ-1/PfpI family protein [Bacteroides reticulotermitis]MBB4045430.1 putative intracellular protease/amidase [Bacteroides reticulotermitis]GAE86055.1 protease [Bacteroides reticulotermitis JCM 10512]
MTKRVAVLAVDPVNGFGLFQYLEAFFENGISYKVFAVADQKEIRTNSGISLSADDVIANLKGHEDEYDALVFACGDAIPVFRDNADKAYNVNLLEVIKTFGERGKLMIGHCAGAMMFDLTGITQGKKVAVHPLGKAAIRNGIATDNKSEVDGNFFTAQEENTIWTMMPQLLQALKSD